MIRKLKLLILLAGLGAACKTVTSPPVQTVVTDCAAPALRDLAVHLLDDVASALVTTGDWRVALAAVAARAGVDGLAAVKCAVAEIFAKTTTQLASRSMMDAATAQRTQTIHDRAAAWLAENP